MIAPLDSIDSDMVRYDEFLNPIGIVKFSGEFRFLSNFFMHSVFYKGEEFKSNEHAYQYRKTDSPMWKEAIKDCASPSEARKQGRMAPIVDNWDEIKYGLLMDINVVKYQDPILRKKLIETSPYYLIEGNTWHDNYFGVCSCYLCKHKKSFNNLGKILMRIRSEIAMSHVGII